jgi:imidazole glycerol-phosphate synthase subunit HisH
MRITLFDYGAGNLHSLGKALAVEGADVRITADPREALRTDLLVLPGVGGFGPAAERLAPGREAMADALKSGLPAVGVCLGMQLMFDDSDEGPGRGLGYFRGRVSRIAARRVPHMGWNQVEGPLALDAAYFAHSFVCRAEDPEDVLAWTAHEGDRFPCVVRRGRVLGVQFHPEKSSRPGLELLRRFIREVGS